jgi:pimeloyl-ACP methyl ester carboxylesterase
MPMANVRGVGIKYEVLGDKGPWIVVTGGGRMDMEVFRPLGECLAEAGNRVIIHDRRNCGDSDIAIGGDPALSEEQHFADDTHELLTQLGAAPVYACGGAAGSRMSLLLAHRHPDDVAALLLWWPTGGKYSSETLARNYYGQFIDVAKEGGMAAVCETEYYKERIERNPGNRERLMSMKAEDFIDTMTRWQQFFLDSVDYPVIGLDEATVRSIIQPAIVIPGHDDIHPKYIGEQLPTILPNAILVDEPPSPPVSPDNRKERQAILAKPFLEFIKSLS